MQRGRKIRKAFIIKIMKRISKKVASSKYGVITTGINSQYKYFLNEKGEVVDSDGDVRYTPPVNEYKKILKNTEAYKANVNLCDNCGKHPVEMKDYREDDTGNSNKIYSCRYCASLNSAWHYRVRVEGLDPKEVLEQ
jgi:hypothetical protein